MADANTSLGQLGLALLKNPTDDAAKLILYKTKDHILSTLQLTKATKVYWKPPYLQYHDSQQGFWSLFFTSDKDSTEFFAELGEVCTIDGASATIDINAVATDSTKAPVDSMKTETNTTDSIDAPKPKSDVVYRVSKIGHQLPKMKATAADDDSDSTLPSDTERIPNPQPSIKSIHAISSDRVVYPAFQHPSKPTNISLALQPPLIWSSLSSPSTSTFDLNAFASENRIQNTEVRMNLTKLDSKLDRVLDNVERKFNLISLCILFVFIKRFYSLGLWLVSSKSNNAHDKEEEIIKLEEKVLELKKENRAFKAQLSESSGDRIKKDSDNKEAEILLQKTIEEKELKIVELTSKVQELTEKNQTIEEKFNTAMETEKCEREQLLVRNSNELDELRSELERKNNELQAMQQDKSKESNTNNGEMIRSIMNQFYTKLFQNIEGKSTLSSADVLKLTAEIIRKETKAALNTS